MSRGGTATLSIASILAFAGIVLVAIAFGTSDWRIFTLSEEPSVWEAKDPGESGANPNRNPLIFTREYGFFKFCFANTQKPDDFPYTLAKSPLGWQCGDISYTDNITSSITDEQKQWIHMKRLYLSLYVVGLFFCLVSILTLLAGCARSSHPVIITTGVLLLLAGFFVASAIGVWHKFVLLDEDSIISKAALFLYPDFPPAGPDGARTATSAIITATARSFGWSYIIAWVGVGLLLLGAVFMFIAACLISWSDTNFQRHKSSEIVDRHALVAVPPGAYQTYDKQGVYASPYYAQSAGSGSPYGTGYANYGYHTYNPYAYYYASHYYPYSSYSLR